MTWAIFEYFLLSGHFFFFYLTSWNMLTIQMLSHGIIQIPYSINQDHSLPLDCNTHDQRSVSLSNANFHQAEVPLFNGTSNAPAMSSTVMIGHSKTEPVSWEITRSVVKYMVSTWGQPATLVMMESFLGKCSCPFFFFLGTNKTFVGFLEDYQHLTLSNILLPFSSISIWVLLLHKRLKNHI